MRRQMGQKRYVGREAMNRNDHVMVDVVDRDRTIVDVLHTVACGDYMSIEATAIITE